MVENTGVTFFSALISLALVIWFVVFSIMVVKRLDKLVELLSQK